MRLSIKKLFLRTLGRVIPSDFFSHRFPVSVKGVCFIDDKVVLLKNERGEWDLPGGKLRKKEDIVRCLAREIREELNITVRVGNLLSAIQIDVLGAIDVLILIYGCSTTATAGELKISQENFGLGLFSMDELNGLQIHPSYSRAIRQAFQFYVLNGR